MQQPSNLLTPSVLCAKLPLSPEASLTVQQTRIAAANIMQGQDDRLLVIVGPCSIHDLNSALEYAQKLKEAINNFKNELCIIMRVYFEKPRTVLGWKGLINDPDLNSSFNINKGLQLARKLLLELNTEGVPAATEFLDTSTQHYLFDLISWCAIGARTSESQVHRELASGLPMPVGFKNSTDGNIHIAIDALNVARYPHHLIHFSNDGSLIQHKTSGNQNCHIVLRGGRASSNYSVSDIEKAATALHEAGCLPFLMVDCSHGNSMKNYLQQRVVVKNLVGQMCVGSQYIAGVMIESHLVSGNQFLIPGVELRYGQSITDSCLSWDETLPLLEQLAEGVVTRRRI